MTNNERLTTIKQRVIEVKKHHDKGDYQVGDDILYLLFDNHIDWLLEQAERSVKGEKDGLSDISTVHSDGDYDFRTG